MFRMWKRNKFGGNIMKKQKRMSKKGSISDQIAIILWFAGACLIVLFTLAWIVLSKLI